MSPLGRRDLCLASVVVLGASLALLALAQVYPIRDFYVTGNALMSNDQVGYITTGRWLAETGELRSHLIYPAHVRDPAWRLYMPGAYSVHAVNHILLGPGALAWRIPAMVSFVLAAVGVFFIGCRFHGRVAGAVAAALFALFPPIAAYAFTAMPQLPFMAAGVVAFGIFVYLPARWQSYLLPVLLVGPFLFRETGALLIIPMVLVAFGARPRPRWSSLAMSVSGSVVILWGLLRWQEALGKAALPLQTVRGFNYANAFPGELAPNTVHALLADRAANVVANLDAVRSHLALGGGVALSLTVILVFAVIAVVRGLRPDAQRHRDWLALGAGLLTFVAASVITTFYTWQLYRGLRALLFTFPLLAVSMAPLLVSGVQRLQRPLPRPARVLPALGVGALLLGVFWWSTTLLRPGFSVTAGRRTVEFMERLDPDPDGVLVAPGNLALDYVLRHYPLRYSFVPGNARTLRLLGEKHRVQTLLVDPATRQGRSVRYREAIRELGLVPVREEPHPLQAGRRVLVFERPRSLKARPVTTGRPRDERAGPTPQSVGEA